MTAGEPETSTTGPAISAGPAVGQATGQAGGPAVAPAAAASRTPPAPGSSGAGSPLGSATPPGATAAGPTLTALDPVPPAPGADAARVIRPSVVHVPASLLPLVAAERLRSGRSNGQILIDAIEAGHEHLVKLHNESNSIGGRLFTARTAKPRLPVDQPLSPLNIRLYEQDYEVLDRLVNELGAGSRSRLATLALARYLDGSA